MDVGEEEGQGVRSEETESEAAAAAASRLRGLSLVSAAPVSLATVADALELLARMRRAVASGEEEQKNEGKKKREEVEGGNSTAASSSSPSASSQPPPPPPPVPPAACPWSSPDHLYSYALFWDLAPFVDERDVEVALAVERAAWKRKKKENE